MSLQDTHVSLAHGNGGRYMRELIKEIFARHLANPLLDTDTDAAIRGLENPQSENPTAGIPLPDHRLTFTQ